MLDGRVIAVTGAGRGLGRSHAITLAGLGAQVVVNDIDDSAAEVAAEIGSGAAACVAPVDAAAGAAAIVDTALAAFGRINGLVNNAGFLRDASFGKMDDDQWRAVVDVHLHGAWHCTRAAWPHFQAQGFGRVVLTTSHAGLFGNHGQANYAAAKMALVGLASTLAIEGRRHDIGVNVVAPLAATRLAAGARGLGELASLDPAPVSALVAWLCSPECSETGTVVGAAGGRYQRYLLCEGEMADLGAAATAADVAAASSRIMATAAMSPPTQTSFAQLLGAEPVRAR